MARPGPKTPEGKRSSSLNGSRHFFRRDGIRPCYRKCPMLQDCQVRPEIGEPCPIEAEEFERFVGRLLSRVRNPEDPILRALAENLGTQWVRRQRALEYLAGRPEGKDLTLRYHLHLVEQCLRKGFLLFRELAKGRGKPCHSE